MDESWIKFVVELQSIAQSALYYCKDIYDIERFKRIREISAEMVSMKSGLDIDVVENLFCNEVGYQTPKIDTRAAIFQNGKILLVKENEEWSLPGGWLDVNESVKSNIINEVKEEAGLDVIPVRLIAIQDRDKHNKPKYVYSICKIFVLCEIISGEFQPNNETTESGFFDIKNLPALDMAKNTPEQIQLCIDANKDKNWAVQFD